MLPKLVSVMFCFQRSRLMLSLCAALLVFVASVLVAAQPATATDDPPKSAGAYQIGPGDVIRVTVLKQDLLSQDAVRIGNDGKIRLPMLQEPVHAACLTEAKLAADITERYRKYILNPQVYVSVREFNSSSVAVIGAVNSPGRFQLQRPVRLLEMMTFVNGPSAAAGDELQILRASVTLLCEKGNDGSAGQEFDTPGEPEIISFPINDVLSGSGDANPYLRGGDIVRVVAAELKQAYLVGSVRNAMTVNLKDPVTLSTALAMAGGTADGAQLTKIKITRHKPGSLTKTDVFVNLKEIRDGSKPDLLLEPNDIVDVPGPSGTKKFLKDIFRTIVPVFTRVPMVIP